MACNCDATEEWWRDPDEYDEIIRRHGGQRKAAAAHGISQSSLSKWGAVHRGERTAGQRQGPKGERPGSTMGRSRGVVITEPQEGDYNLNDLPALLASRGIDPEQWEIERVKVNEWEAYAGRDAGDDGPGEPRVVTLHQLTAHLKRKVDTAWVFAAADIAARVIPEPGTALPPDRLVWLGGDEQAPYNDAALERAMLRWMADVRPDELIGLGDVLDFPTISRHADRPSWSATAQTCIDAAFAIASSRRDVLPDARWRIVRGNHDYRLESELLTRAERMFGIRPADDGGEAVAALSLRRLLHLDALGIELVGSEGDKWELARIEVAPGLVAQHRLGKTSRVRQSVVAGDSHRQSIKRVTEWDDGVMQTRTLVEAGCLCLPHGGLGYALDPDWQQGFATVSVSASGALGYDLASWDGRELTWRGERWTGR